MIRRILLVLLATICSSSLILGQGLGTLPFGKNKIQYQRFNWRFIQSENFDVYFHEGGEYIARYTAYRAEKALAAIEGELSFSITKRIVFIVYTSHNQFQQTNVIDEYMSEGIGGVTELFKNRIVIPFEGDYHKFSHVIHHELVHAVLNDMFYGGSIQSLVNNSVRAIIPLWMNEGYAEWSAAGGLDVKTDQFMRDVAVSEYLRGLNQLNGYFAYRGGQAFWWYVAEKYGKGKVGEVFNRFRAIGDVNQTFKVAFGMTYEEMSEQWAKDLKKYYFPDVDRYEYVEDYATRLTNHRREGNFYNTSPAISPDGERVAFISDRDGLFGVFVLDLNSKRVRKLVSSGRSNDFEQLNILTPGVSWSPDGKRIALGAKAGREDVIYLIDVESGRFQRLEFDLQTIGSVAWSPDGKRLAFDAAPAGSQSDIYIYDLSTRVLSKATDDIFSDSQATWAPDNKTVYFISDRGRYTDGQQQTANFLMWKHDVDQADIYSVDIESKIVTRITTDPLIGKNSIAVSPDHRSILFVADYNGIGNLWELDLATRTRKARTNSLQEVSQISLSSDGSKLVFASQNRVGYDLFLLKFPFDRKTLDTLPMTRYRRELIDKQSSLAGILEAADAPSGNDDAVAPYGTYDIDFGDSRQARPNPDAPTGERGGAATASVSPEDFVPRDYRVGFSPDIIVGQAGYNNWFGAQGVTQMLFSDMLGDHEIFFQANIFIDLANSNFYLQYSYLPDIIDLRFSAHQNAGFTYLGGEFNRLRNYGVGAFASYPFSRFSRLDWGVQAMVMSRENIDRPETPSLTRFVTVPQISYVLDNSIPGMWAPMDGRRWNITLEGSPSIGSQGIAFSTLRTDYREYIHLGGPYVFALRGSGGASFGPNPQKFFVGGTDNWINRSFSNGELPFQNPEDFAFLRPGWPMRGYPINIRNGSRYVVTNAEFRFPLLFAFQAGPIPALFQGLQGNLFFDMGGAFDDQWNAREVTGAVSDRPLLWSTGIGIRSLALGLPLRIDVAWRRDVAGFSEPVWMFSLGGDF
jgi:Tol biopolymer transport system component